MAAKRKEKNEIANPLESETKTLPDKETVTEETSPSQPIPQPESTETVPNENQGTPNKWSFYLPAAFVFVAGVILTSLMVFYSLRAKSEKQTPAPTPEPTPQATQEPLDLKSVQVRIENGSGIAGKAQEVKDFLEAKGYSVSGTGNAQNFDYTETVIFSKNVSKEFLEKLKSDLAEKYQVASEFGELEEDSDFNLLITVGSL